MGWRMRGGRMCAIVQRDDRERLAAAGNLAVSLWHQEKHDEAEKMQREVLAVQQQVRGAEHADTLTTAGNLAVSFKPWKAR